jgi:hypothetical protein
MITDVTERLIQKTIDEGGKVYAYTDTEQIEVVSATGSNIVLKLDSHVLSIGDKIRFLYEPLFKTPYCIDVDTDGDGIIDRFDLDADGDGVWDDRAPDLPSHIVLKVTYEALAPDQVTLDISPLEVDTVRCREWGKALIVDRHYPLYITEEEALLASPCAVPEAHDHFLDERQYWMPECVDQWHGNYHTCKPHAVDNVQVSAVETYDFEYVDRVYGDTGFNSIIPRDYERKLLALDTDENGTFDSEVFYSLQTTYNVGEEYRHIHYHTIPPQAWLYRVASVNASEDFLPDGHSFRLGTWVYQVSVTTKFDYRSEDNITHTQSIFKYLSQLSNGSEATLDSTGGGIIRYVDGNEVWQSLPALELNAQSYVVLEDRLFEEGDEFYIHAELPPSEPVNVRLDILESGDAPSNVRAVGSDITDPSNVNAIAIINPTEVSNVVAGEVVPPNGTPSLVIAGILSGAPSEVHAASEVKFASHVYAITVPSADPNNVTAEIIFDPSTLNLLHWYDASDPNSQVP